MSCNSKGITLVALVITIIIIIILATVAISFAFGNNGLITRAEDASGMYANDTEYTEDSITNVEAYINDILIGTDSEGPIRPTEEINFEEPKWVGDGTATVVITTNNVDEELQYQINGVEDGKWIGIKSGETITGLKHNDNVYGRLWNGEDESDYASTSVKDTIAPTVNITAENVTSNSVTLNVEAVDEQSGLVESETYKYYLDTEEEAKETSTNNSHTYTGLTVKTGYTLKVVVTDKAGLTTTKTTSITTADYPTIETTLKEGNYVYYTDGTGVQRTCVVLYGPENTNYSSYGIQIITMNIVEDIKLGVLNDISASRTSYNNGISTLNNATSKYLNTTYATKVRSVGSVPNNPTYDAAGMFTMSAEDNWTGYFTQYNGTFKDSDDNYVADWEQMSNLNIYNIEDTYWLASRLVEVDSSSYVEIGLREVSSSGKLRGSGTTLLAAQRPEDNLIDEVTQGLRPVFTLKAGLKVTGGAGTSTSPYTLGV